MRLVLPIAVFLALFLLLWAGFRFALSSLPLVLLLALGGGLGVGWLQAWALRGLSPWAKERLALKEAWRRGGFLRPEDLGAFLPLEEAQTLLEGLAQRGLCRREGEGYRF